MGRQLVISVHLLDEKEIILGRNIGQQDQLH